MYNISKNYLAAKAASFIDSRDKQQDTIADGPKLVHKRWEYVQLPGQSIGFPVSYLISRNSSPDVMVFLHGFLSSELTINQPDFFSTDKWLDVRVEMQQEPNIVSISFGMLWMLHSQSRTLFPQYSTAPTFMAVLEKLLTQYELQGKRRFLVGSSMGGFNALKLVMAGKWDRALLHVPMIAKQGLDPFSFNFFDPEFWKFYSAPIIRGQFTKEEWLYEEPLLEVRNGTLGTSKIQVQVSKKDEFNLYEGGKDLFKVLQAKGVDVELVENAEGHKDLNVERAATFLS